MDDKWRMAPEGKTNLHHNRDAVGSMMIATKIENKSTKNLQIKSLPRKRNGGCKTLDFPTECYDASDKRNSMPVCLSFIFCGFLKCKEVTQPMQTRSQGEQ
jgi:hypothetical protein